MMDHAVMVKLFHSQLRKSATSNRSAPSLAVPQSKLRDPLVAHLSDNNVDNGERSNWVHGVHLCSGYAEAVQLLAPKETFSL